MAKIYQKKCASFTTLRPSPSPLCLGSILCYVKTRSLHHPLLKLSNSQFENVIQHIFDKVLESILQEWND